MVELKHNVKQVMDNVQTLPVDLMRHTQRSPSVAAVYFRHLNGAWVWGKEFQATSIQTNTDTGLLHPNILWSSLWINMGRLARNAFQLHHDS